MTPTEPGLDTEQLRTVWNQELETLTGLSDELTQSMPDAEWLDQVLPRGLSSYFTGPCRDLETLSQTELPRSKIAPGPDSNPDSFRFNRLSRAWELSDTFLQILLRRLTIEGQRRQAGRLFLLHEAIHRTSQGITESTSVEIGMLGKVIEEADYFADVWALLYELRLGMARREVKPGDERVFLWKALNTALATMWAFDDASGDTLTIQVRRLNRYLIWYWQLLRIERADSFADAVEVFATKPQIELVGPKLTHANKRSWFKLRDHKGHLLEPKCELGVMHNTRLARFAHGGVVDLLAILRGVATRNGDLIRSSLKPIFDLLPPVAGRSAARIRRGPALEQHKDFLRKLVDCQRNHFVVDEISYTYDILHGGMGRCTMLYSITPTRPPVYLDTVWVGATDESADCIELSNLGFSAFRIDNGRDHGREQSMDWILVEQSGRKRKIALLFVPPVESSQSVRYGVRWSWPGLWRSLFTDKREDQGFVGYDLVARARKVEINIDPRVNLAFTECVIDPAPEKDYEITNGSQTLRFELGEGGGRGWKYALKVRET